MQVYNPVAGQAELCSGLLPVIGAGTWTEQCLCNVHLKFFTQQLLSLPVVHETGDNPCTVLCHCMWIQCPWTYVLHAVFRIFTGAVKILSFDIRRIVVLHAVFFFLFLFSFFFSCSEIILNEERAKFTPRHCQLDWELSVGDRSYLLHQIFSWCRIFVDKVYLILSFYGHNDNRICLHTTHKVQRSHNLWLF